MTKEEVLNSFTKHRHDNKSIVFLYPLLQMPKRATDPINTYLYLNEKKDNPYRYLCVLYHESQGNFEETMSLIEKHPLYDFELTDEGYYYKVFTFDEHAKHFDLVLAGDYHKIEGIYKILLSKHALAAIGCNPKQYHANYIAGVETTEDEVPKGTQLLMPPDSDNETIIVSEKVIKDYEETIGQLFVK